MGALNSFVHVVMYSYYLLTALNPKYKNNLWWKKYITQLQIVRREECGRILKVLKKILFSPADSILPYHDALDGSVLQQL